MTMTVARFRREVQRRRGARRRGAARYPDAMVSFALEHVRVVRAQGESLSSAAAALGLSVPTLSAWLSRSGRRPRNAFREVRIEDATPKTVEPSTLTVTTPSGHVVTGLGVEQAAALLRALS